MERVFTEKAPAAIGPYSQAMKVGNLVYTSGQIPIDPKTGNVEATDIAGQTRQVMENLKAVLEAAAEFINRKYGEGTVELTIRDSYFNMREKIEPCMYIIDRAKAAM